MTNGGFAGYTFRVRNNGPDTAPNAIVSIQLPSGSDTVLGGNCVGGTGFGSCTVGSVPSGGQEFPVGQIQFNDVPPSSHIIRAAVTGGTSDPDTSNNLKELTVTVSAQRTNNDRASRLPLESFVQLDPPTSASGRITLNGDETVSTTGLDPEIHPVLAVTGRNTVVAHIQLSAAQQGRWRFRITRSHRLVPGSLRAVTGDLLSRESSSLTFSLRPGANEIRFTFELSAPDSDPR